MSQWQQWRFFFIEVMFYKLEKISKLTFSHFIWANYQFSAPLCRAATCHGTMFGNDASIG